MGNWDHSIIDHSWNNLSWPLNKKFSEFVTAGKKDNAVETARFLIATLDNEKTYILMNYYLMNFLLAFGKGAKKESTRQIQAILATENLVPNGFAEVVAKYKNLTRRN